MNDTAKETALFRLMVIGPIISSNILLRGELKTMVHELAARAYSIPGSKNTHLSEKTIERWYYLWARYGFDGLAQKKRNDYGKSSMPRNIQDAILQLKHNNPARSINTIMRMLEAEGKMAKGQVSRSSIHRFLKRSNLSKRTLADASTIERRSFEAQHAGDIWYGDVMHGPSIFSTQGKRKTYLVSLMDDASRLIVHNEFRWGETALDIESTLKQALLKRGLPKKLVIDNGPAYRSTTLQLICARLDIKLVYCRPYEPEGKGKLERWHRTFREQFLSEINLESCKGLPDINARLWAWVDQVYHQQPHHGLNNKMTPLTRWRQDLIHVRPLGHYANKLDDHFYYRFKRRVKKDGTVSFEGKQYEVKYELVGQEINLVVDPQAYLAVKVESLDGEQLCVPFLLDKKSNCHRQRQRPAVIVDGDAPNINQKNEVDLALEKYQRDCTLTDCINTEEEN